MKRGIGQAVIYVFFLFLPGFVQGMQVESAKASFQIAGIPISGRIFSDIYAPTRALNSTAFEQASASVWLEANPKFNENSLSHFILTADAFDTSVTSESHQLKMGLREGYIEFSKSGWLWRVGRQIIPWGKSDAVNPTDFLSAKDFSLFNPDEEVKRIGSNSIWVSWVPHQGNSPWNLITVWTPIFPQSKLLISPDSIPAGVTLAADPQLSTATLTRSEVALKTIYAGIGWDASLVFFRGWNHMPELGVSSVTSLAPLTVTVAQSFHRINAMGTDGSFTSGKYIFRIETAYDWTENNNGQNPLILPSHWDTVLGVERPLIDEFRIQAQLVWRYIPRMLPADQVGGASPGLALVNAQVANVNALILNYQQRSRPASTIRLSYNNENHGIEAEVFILTNFIGGDYLMKPKFTYSWNDAFKTAVGIDYYGGPSNRPLGALKNYDSAFFEARYLF